MSDPFIEYLVTSGWNTVPSITAGLEGSGLPVPDSAYLQSTFSRADWNQAHRLAEALQDRFKDAAFGATTVYGPMLIPDPAKLDTRAAIPTEIRADQTEVTRADFVEKALREGVSIVEPGTDWTLVVSVTSPEGPALGSHADIVDDADPRYFLVCGCDTRALMVRQAWGAATLQCGQTMPNCERRASWTFSLFPGEGMTGDRVASGTVLHGAVRHRLGSAHRGIKSARVCPTLTVDA